MDAIFKLSVFVNMVDNLTQPIGSAGKAVDDVTKKLDSLDNGFRGLAKSGMAMTAIGMEITKAALAPVGATFKTQKALGELSSLGIEDLKALEKSAKDFSNTWAGTTKADFLTAAYDIKQGISSLNDDAVAEYTKFAAITAKATKSNVGEITDLFSTGYGIYRDFYGDLSDIEFGEIFSAGIAKSVQQFNTDASKMMQSLEAVGNQATSANVPLEEQLSILGMLQATMPASDAGAKYKSFLQTATAAGKGLKLSFTDANGTLLSMPEILSQLKSKFGDTLDAAEKMKLKEAFGSEDAVILIEKLYGKTSDLEGNILGLYDTMGAGVSVATEMADAINQTEGEKFVVLKQRIDNTIETIGTGMLPTINKWMDKGAELLEQISCWIENNQELVSKIFLLIAVIGAIITVMGVFNVAVGFIGTTVIGSIKHFGNFIGIIKGIPGVLETMQIKGMYAADAIKGGFAKISSASSTAITSIGNVSKNIFNMAKTAAINGVTALKNMALSLIGMAKQAITTAVTAMPGLIGSVWSFTAALLANPITWVIVGIVALIAALILLWQNWDAVVAWLNGAWNSAVQGVLSAFNWIKEKVASMPDGVLALIAVFMPFIGIPLLILKHWDSIKDFFKNLWTNIKTGFTSFIDGWIPNMLASGKKVISTFCDGIKSMVSKPAEIVKEGLAKVRNLLPFSDAKEGPLSELTLSGSKVFTTLGEGMEKTADIPSSIAYDSFANVERDYNFPLPRPPMFDPFSFNYEMPDQMDFSDFTDIDNLMSIEHNFNFDDYENFTFDKYPINNEENRKVFNSEENIIKYSENKIKNETTNRSLEKSEPSISIGNVHLNFDIKDLEDLKLLKRLAYEIKHLANQDNNEPETLIPQEV